MSDSNLICFFSFARAELVKRSLDSLLESVRPQDRLLVIDQEMRNFDLYAEYRDKIDFLFFMYLNYDIGPVWMFLRNFIMWKKSLIDTYVNVHKNPVKGWYPDYVNIVESDTIGKKGWIDRVVKIFDSSYPVGIASGYDGIEHRAVKWDGKIKIKDVACGVQVMFKTEHYLNLFEVLHIRSQDGHASERNKKMGKVVGVLPGEIEHIGADMKTHGSVKEINI